MHKDLTHYRRSYEKGSLMENDLPEDPLILFESWFNLADESTMVQEANAMSIATVGKDSWPRTRIVLLKSFSREGFTFFTNYKSAKGKDLELNPKSCLSFFWPSLEKQIIIQGLVSKIREQESEEYFNSRPRGSQLGAHVSNQSSVVSSRKVLEERLNELEKKFENQPVPKPSNWGGYLVKPQKFEFWQGRQSRLHDRILYSREENKWKIERLAP